MSGEPTLQEAVVGFEDGLKEVLEDKLRELEPHHAWLSSLLEGKRAVRKQIFVEALETARIPREKWGLYWDFVRVLGDVPLKEALAKTEAELVNIRQAYFLLIAPPGSKDLEVERARTTPIQGVFSGELKRSGKFLKGRCLFHSDDSPSLVLYPETNSFYCFGCGEGGSVIDFVMKRDGVNFVEAVKWLTI